MKITKRQLRRIIKEEMSMLALPDLGLEDVVSHDKKDPEVGMAVNQLQAISATALELSEMIKSMDYVPEWGDGKIATVLDRLNSIRSYMLGKSMGQE